MRRGGTEQHKNVMLNFRAPAALVVMEVRMPKRIVLAAAIAAAAVAPSGALAQPPHTHPAYVCTGTPPQYDPADLNQMRASVDAASRLALAIRQREYLASCHRVYRPRHHLG